MRKTHETIRTPSYYIRKRLLNNWPALFGLAIIVLAVFAALLGYLIMPDSTPSANDGAIQIQKQLPGYTTYILKKRRNVHVEHRNVFQKMFFGQESEFTIIPIKSYKFKGFNLEFVPDGRIQMPETFPLIEIVYALHDSPTDLGAGKLYFYSKDKIYYTKSNGEAAIVTQAEIANKFLNEHLEERTYILGTDKAGRDIFSRLLFGTRISLGIGLVAVVISLILGISIGATGGFFGGATDRFVMWIMTVVWSIPSIMLVIAISLALQSKGIWVAFVAVGLTSWVEIARVVRGQIMSIKEKTYVEAARAMGFSNFRIIFIHILPNVLGPIIVIATSNFATAILTEAGLSFLGLGVQPPMPSWGMMVNEGFHAIGTQNSWHLILFPSLAISLLVFAFNLFGNGLRDAYDPQQALKW
ncbi:MAG: ABC transporter permease [Cytophagales bacterium]